MAKYTTLVRSICESKAGLVSSVGCDDVDSVIEESWDKIFTTNVAFFDESYRKFICCKILKHYYTREIGAETVGLWKLWLNTKLEEIMPYYNQLYISANIDFNPLNDVNYIRSITTSGNSDTITGDNGESTSSDLFSDTPQGGLNGVENQNYLTTARKVTNEMSANGTSNNTYGENVTESITGKQGTKDYSEMLIKYRESFLNIDMLVIEEFEELFMGLW